MGYIKGILSVFVSHSSMLARHARILANFPSLRCPAPCTWVYDNISSIKIGNNVSIGRFSEIVVLQRSSFTSVNGSLHIGDRAVIGTGANIRAAGGEIMIGRNALLAQNITLVSANHVIGDEAPYRDLAWDTTRTGVFLGENTWIGAGAIVLPGSAVGEGAIVAAGAVVTTSIPPFELWGGVPARRLKSLRCK